MAGGTSASTVRPRLRLSGDAGWPPAGTFGLVAVSASAWLAMSIGMPGHMTPVAASTLAPADLILARAARAMCGPAPGWGAALSAHLQWLAGWAIMVLAMMLPPTLPFLRTVGQVAGGGQGRLVLIAALAFVATWIAAGLCVMAGASLLAQLPLPAPLAEPQIVAGFAAMLAGAYQFTPLKKACLDACRSPRAVLLCHWNGLRPAQSAVKVGLRYGGICIGCCWATMLLTLIVGAYALPLMVFVSAIMLGERLLPNIRPLIPVQAAFALLLGALLLAGRMPAGAAWAML